MTSSLVRDVMTTEVVTAEPSTPFKEIAARLAQHRISAVPVVDAGRRVLGIITEADLLLKQEHPDPKADVSLIWTRRRRRERAKAAAAVAGKLMTAPAATVAPTATVTEAARRMHTAGVKRLPVVDETGRLVGIVSRADLLKVFTRPDEAIRSQIISEVIVGDFMMDPSRLFIEVDDGVVLLQGKAERSSLIPYLVRAVHHVEGVVRVEDRLTADVDDRDADLVMAYPRMRA
ncbi:MAG TPA: CBS domain-containing protein [Actinomycetota bacterium]|nr:CBS domain-containing protein [Actinomycetota bacterium]